MVHTLNTLFPVAVAKDTATLWARFKSNLYDLECADFDPESTCLCIALRVAAGIIVKDLANCLAVHPDTTNLAHKVLALTEDPYLINLYDEDREAFNDLIFTEYVDCTACGVDSDQIYSEVRCRSLELILSHPVANRLDAQLIEDIEEFLKAAKR